jgi:hypothetical protein
MEYGATIMRRGAKNVLKKISRPGWSQKAACPLSRDTIHFTAGLAISVT